MHSKAVIDEKNDGQQSIWKVVAGPMGAAYASLIRVGWAAQGPCRRKTAAGQDIEVLNTSAKDSDTLFKRNVQNWLWSKAGATRERYSSFMGTPLVEPVLALLRRKPTEKWNHTHQGMLKAIVADAWNDGAPCPLCQQERHGAWHLWVCPALEVFVREYGMPAEFLRCPRDSAHALFFSKTRIPHPARSYPAPLREAEVEWQVAPGHEPFFHG